MTNQFLTNTSNPSLLNYIKNELLTCDSFYFSVSFIKDKGLNLLKSDIEDALKRKAKGFVLTSSYQNFTDISSLQTFLIWQETYENFNCHIEFHDLNDQGFHTKGYLFLSKHNSTVILGSSNITYYALMKNIEWNMVHRSSQDSDFFMSVYKEFFQMWNQTSFLTTSIIDRYKDEIKLSIVAWDMDDVHITKDVKPNQMQIKALNELKKQRLLQVKKALVIAATGSGKTFLAAFDVRAFSPDRVLYVVHRETILKDAFRTFKHVLKNDYTYGYLTGSDKDFDSDILFATNITLSKNLNQFDKKHFDYIIIDEVHHASASSYQAIIEYFQPHFLLGLTATPERTEDEDAIFSLFEYNVPFEMRLGEALKYELVSPFHYYGIRDTLINYDQKDARLIIKDMILEEHIQKIDFEIQKHLPNSKLKCIGFCIDVDHANEMSKSFNKIGYNSISLTGKDTILSRMEAFERVQDDNDNLEIIFTVDILNEGVDIPKLNMILFLRPTESPIVFLQQLGRGLRRIEGKSHVVVLDFIGNSYLRSIQIARALGSLSSHGILEKQTLIDMITNNFSTLDIPGVKIEIDDLSKEDIKNYIEKTNFNRFDFLKADYTNFKKYINTTSYPTHMDYVSHEVAPDLNRFIQSKIQSKKSNSYYTFLKHMEENLFEIDQDELQFLEFLTYYLPLVRYEDFMIVKYLLEVRVATLDHIMQFISYEGYPIRKFHIESAIRYLFSKNKLVEENGIYKLNILLENQSFLDHTQDLIEYGLAEFNKRSISYENTFVPYQRYRTDQVILLTSTDKVYVYQKGTKIDDHNIYIFAILHKNASTEIHLNYDDGFINDGIFRWESEVNTTLEKHRGLIGNKKAHIFVRKSNEEDGITLPYLYIGAGTLTSPRVNPNNPKNTLLFDIVLDNRVPKEFQEELGVPNE